MLYHMGNFSNDGPERKKPEKKVNGITYLYKKSSNSPVRRAIQLWVERFL